MIYSFSEFVKNGWSLIVTRLLFRPARLIRRPVYIRGRQKMCFGHGFTTGYRCRFDLLSDQNVITLNIGTNCKIGDNVHIVALESVIIGDDCLMASNIFISDTNHGNSDDSPMVAPDDRLLSTSPVLIGDRVWLGEGVAVLPGSEIGDGCIIGAHSVVKGYLPPNTIAVGAPAHPVKQYNFQTEVWEKLN